MSRRALSALGALLAVLAAAPLAAAVEPPVPLRAPLPLVPDELAGSGVTPEAAVRVSIDERGIVRKVEVLSIRPSTDYDEVVRQELVETLLKWRYAPQRRDGEPEATTLEWRVRFPGPAEAEKERREDGASGTGLGGVPQGAAGGADAELRRSRILALPRRQRREMLAREVKVARGLLDPDHVHEATSAHVVVQCDADDARVAGLVANDLEGVFHVLATELLPGVDLLSESDPLQVVVYRSHAEYLELTSKVAMYEWSAGYYSPAGLIAFHLEQPSNDAVLSILLHEGTHAFMDRYVVRRGVALPRWLGEGFADYVGNSEIHKGRLVPGKTLRHKYELSVAGVASVTTGGGFDLDAAKTALRKGKGLGVQTLLGASREVFYGEDRDLFYASAWLLVHYLRDGEDGWAESRFPQALVYVAEGYPPATVFRQLYGPLDALDRSFRDYVRKF